MLGSMLTDYLSRDPALKVVATVRSIGLAERCCDTLPRVEWRLFDADAADADELASVIAGAAWIVNAIGVTKPYTHDEISMEVERAIRINALLPHRLAKCAEQSGARVLQIATDCVYSGLRGAYVETDAHDALDVYGKTKSLGERCRPNLHNLRCSIVGPEPKAYVFLLEWFRRQPKGARLNGYTNHRWNGITTLQFARLCHGIITGGLDLPAVQHIVPEGVVSKAELLQCFARAFRRTDVVISPVEAGTVVNRDLATANETLNQELWLAAGYEKPPSVPEMVEELSRFEYAWSGLVP